MKNYCRTIHTLIIKSSECYCKKCGRNIERGERALRLWSGQYGSYAGTLCKECLWKAYEAVYNQELADRVVVELVENRL